MVLKWNENKYQSNGGKLYYTCEKGKQTALRTPFVPNYFFFKCCSADRPFSSIRAFADARSIKINCSSSSAFKTPFIIFLRLASNGLLSSPTINSFQLWRTSLILGEAKLVWGRFKDENVSTNIWGGSERYVKIVSLQFGLPYMKPAEPSFGIWKHFLSGVLSQTLRAAWISAICQKQFTQKQEVHDNYSSHSHLRSVSSHLLTCPPNICVWTMGGRRSNQRDPTQALEKHANST